MNFAARMLGTSFLLTIGALAASAANPIPGSETPPKGPPWARDFHEARARALKEGLPLFVYLTKTH